MILLKKAKKKFRLKKICYLYKYYKQVKNKKEEKIF